MASERGNASWRAKRSRTFVRMRSLWSNGEFRRAATSCRRSVDPPAVQRVRTKPPQSPAGRALYRKEPHVAEPDRLLITYEDWKDARFGLVGRYGGGNQFMAFATGAFPKDWSVRTHSPEYSWTRWAEHKRWYAVLHRFGPGGEHLGTEVYSGGTTAEGEAEAIDRALRALGAMLEKVMPFQRCPIRVKPFGVEIDGYFFGLVYKCVDADDPDDPERTDEYVMLQPNDLMFHPPWDSGEYSS